MGVNEEIERRVDRRPYLADHAYNETLLLDLVGFNSVGVGEDLAWNVWSENAMRDWEGYGYITDQNR